MNVFQPGRHSAFRANKKYKYIFLPILYPFKILPIHNQIAWLFLSIAPAYLFT